jgi:predicted Zn-ribbon and HTH transcriptional regulator
VTLRRQLIDLLSQEPRSVSSLARELGMTRGDVEDNLRHAIRSAQAHGHDVEVIPARCKTCGFLFGEEKLTKPSRCPACRGMRVFEPMIRVRNRDTGAMR